jgi:hypothetical protein
VTLHRARTWALRLIASCWMLAGWLPRPLYIVFLEWLHDDMPHDHPAMGQVLAELAYVKEQA